MSDSSDRPLGFFDGLADEPIEERDVGQKLGFTEKRWLTHPRIRNTPLDYRHDTKPVGKIITPYIGHAVDNPKKRMLAFRGGLYLDHADGRRLYHRVSSKTIAAAADEEELFFSIHYTQGLDTRQGRLDEPDIRFVSLLENPRNRRCRITRRQGADGQDEIHLLMPVQMLMLPASDATKTNSGFPLLRLPVLPIANTTASMASQQPAAAATPAVVPTTPSTPAPPTPGTAAPASPAPATPAMPPSAPTSMDEVNPADLVKKLMSLPPEEQKRLALQAMLPDTEKQDLMAKNAELEKFRQDTLRQQQQLLQEENERRMSETSTKFKPLLQELGVDGDKKDEQLASVYKHLLVSREGKESKADQLLTRTFEMAARERQQREKLEQENLEQRLLLEQFKKSRGAFASPQTATAIKQEQQTAAAQAAAQAQQQAAADVRRAAQQTAHPSALHPATMTAMMNPAMHLKLPMAIGTSGTRMAVVNQQPQGQIPGTQAVSNAAVAPPPALQQLVVAQQADPSAPSTGDTVLQRFAEDPRVKAVQHAFSTGDPTMIRAPNGQIYDMTQLFPGQPPVIYPSDRVALQNAMLNRGIGATQKTSNQLEMFGQGRTQHLTMREYPTNNGSMTPVASIESGPQVPVSVGGAPQGVKRGGGMDN